MGISIKDIPADMRKKLGISNAPKKKRGPNKWEADYSRRILEPLKRAGIIKWYAFEFLKFRLAEGAWYTPDFCLVFGDGHMELREVKGFWREAAKVRVKVFREVYQHWPLVVVRNIEGNWIED